MTGGKSSGISFLLVRLCFSSTLVLLLVMLISIMLCVIYYHTMTASWMHAAGKCMTILREAHIQMAMQRGNYHKVTRDMTGKPLLVWCQEPPYPATSATTAAAATTSAAATSAATTSAAATSAATTNTAS
jgi:hypothetical protein